MPVILSVVELVDLDTPQIVFSSLILVLWTLFNPEFVFKL